MELFLDDLTPDAVERASKVFAEAAALGHEAAQVALVYELSQAGSAGVGEDLLALDRSLRRAAFFVAEGVWPDFSATPKRGEILPPESGTRVVAPTHGSTVVPVEIGAVIAAAIIGNPRAFAETFFWALRSALLLRGRGRGRRLLHLEFERTPDGGTRINLRWETRS